jgi:hypothetical protein
MASGQRRSDALYLLRLLIKKISMSRDNDLIEEDRNQCCSFSTSKEPPSYCESDPKWFEVSCICSSRMKKKFSLCYFVQQPSCLKLSHRGANLAQQVRTHYFDRQGRHSRVIHREGETGISTRRMPVQSTTGVLRLIVIVRTDHYRYQRGRRRFDEELPGRKASGKDGLRGVSQLCRLFQLYLEPYPPQHTL